MTKVLHLQQTLEVPIVRVYRALTEAAELEKWFAEHADVSLTDGRYDFWGRFTPETPGKRAGHHPVKVLEPGKRFQYQWTLRGGDTTVDVQLAKRGSRTVVVVRHHDIPKSTEPGMAGYAFEDVWFLALENLKRHLTGHDVVRCDFSAVRPGDIRHTIAIKGTPHDVWQALVSPDQLNRWIASNASVDLKPGGLYDLGWGPDGGILQILSIDPEREFALRWDFGDQQTFLTWTLEGSGGKTRLTIVHSGFGSDERVDGLNVGWLHFLLWVKSLVEVGADWMPTIKALSRDVALLYAASIWAAQDDLIDENGWDAEIQ